MFSAILIIYFFLTLTINHQYHELDYITPIHNQVNETYITTVEFEQVFTQISDEVDYIQRTLNLNDSNKYSFIIQKCKQIASGLTALRKSLIKFKLMIVPSKAICAGVTQFNRTQINRYISYTEKKEAQLSTYYTTCLDCGFIIPDINKVIDLTHSYFKLVNKTLDGDYCNKTIKQNAVGLIDVNKSYFKNNLAANNWYYGSTTKSDYKIKMFKRSASFNLTSCPQQKPFVRSEQQVCFNCPEGSIYNLGNETCMVCKVNEIFNINTGACQQCLGSKQYQNNIIVCRACGLANSQVYNSTTGKCELCIDNRYIDRKDNLCKYIDCPPITPRFNTTMQQCQSCPLSHVIDPKDPNKCIKTHFVGLCPNQKPIYNDTMHGCEPCPKDTIFNKTSQKCEPNKTSNS